MLAYIAAPLFSAAEISFNELLDSKLRATGIRTHLPQRDGIAAVEGLVGHERRFALFKLATAAVRRSDVLVFIMDGRVPDEGACIELGIAYALGKPCLGLQTDIRRSTMDGHNNLMIDFSLRKVSHEIDDLVETLLGLPLPPPASGDSNVTG